MSKRIKHMLIAATALCIVATVGLTLAFMFKKAEKINRFIPAEVACAVREKTDGSEVTGIAAVGSEKSDIRVENTGNVKEFIRLRLVSYYVDSNGDIAGTAASQYPELDTKKRLDCRGKPHLLLPLSGRTRKFDWNTVRAFYPRADAA